MEAAVEKGDAAEFMRLLGQDNGHAEFKIYGSTLVAIALEKGDYRLADLLIRSGADINQKMPRGMRLLAEFSKGCQTSQFDWVVSHGFRIAPDGADAELEWCALTGCPGIARRLLKLGLNPRKRSVSGETPIDMARRANNKATLSVLLAYDGKNKNPGPRQ
jgi:ankyrin repeat protein